MNSTGPIQSWNIHAREVGPLYPFAGGEVWMVAICVALCLGFMFWKFANEKKKYADQVEKLNSGNNRTTPLQKERDDRSQRH